MAARRDLIKQVALRSILDQRTHLTDLRRALKQAEDALAKDEAVALFQLQRGDAVERGPLAAHSKDELGARRPAWKEEFAKLAGPTGVEAVIARTVAPTRTVLDVTERPA